MPTSTTVILAIGLILLVVLVVFSAAQYSNKSNELQESQDKLESAINESLAIISMFASRVGILVKRLLSSLKQWLLDWAAALSREGGRIIEFFGSGLTAYFQFVGVQMQRISTTALELGNQLQKFLIDFIGRITGKLATKAAELVSKLIIAVVSGVTWAINKVFCFFVGIGTSIATFFTETLANAFTDFYNNYIKVLYTDYLEPLYNYIIGGELFSDLLDELSNLGDIIADAVKDAVDSLF